MATPSRRQPVDLIRTLRQAPETFSFFQAIRLLALAAPPLGNAANIPSQLRFRTPASFAFPASELSAVSAPDRPGPMLELEVSFLGLTGPSGILPQHYTETLLERRHLHRDHTLHAFLDIFNHRACALFYSSWRKYRFQVAYEQGQRDGFTRHLSDLLPMRWGQRRPDHASLPEGSQLHFAGVLARRPLPACSLVAFLEAYFQVPVRLESFVGQWTHVPAAEQTRLGQSERGLGGGAFLGERLWDPQTKVRLRLGPLSPASFREFLPGGPGAQALRPFIQLHLGELLACDLALTLNPGALPSLGLARASPDPPRLGLNTWLHGQPIAHPTQPVFRLQA